MFEKIFGVLATLHAANRAVADAEQLMKRQLEEVFIALGLVTPQLGLEANPPRRTMKRMITYVKNLLRPLSPSNLNPGDDGYQEQSDKVTEQLIAQFDAQTPEVQQKLKAVAIRALGWGATSVAAGSLQFLVESEINGNPGVEGDDPPLSAEETKAIQSEIDPSKLDDELLDKLFNGDGEKE